MYANVARLTSSDNVGDKLLAKAKNLSRFSFKEEVRLKVLDWLAANHNGEASELIDEAVGAYIDGRLDNEPEMRKRFNAARDRRIGNRKPKIVSMNGEPKD